MSFCVCVSITDFVSVCFPNFVEPSLPAVKWPVGFFSVFSFYVRFLGPQFLFFCQVFGTLNKTANYEWISKLKHLAQTLQDTILKMLETKI